MLLSLVYVLFRRALEVVALCFRSSEFKEVEIVVLRHELAVLRRQVGHPRLGDADRVFLAAAGRLLGRARRQSFLVQPDTLLRWHRQLVQVRKILRQAGVSPAGVRAALCWREFLRAHAQSMIACDFFTVETLWLGRLYVLFFIELESRRVHLAGCTANPTGTWVAQQARQLAWSLSERRTPPRFLIHDRDSKLSRAFDEVFRSEGVEIIHTPFRAPRANAFAERWVGTVRRDCLDWILIVSKRQLEHVLRVYVDHYNRHRPHRALGLTPPTLERRLHLVSSHPPDHVQRRDRLGGLIHEYATAA